MCIFHFSFHAVLWYRITVHSQLNSYPYVRIWQAFSHLFQTIPLGPFQCCGLQWWSSLSQHLQTHAERSSEVCFRIGMTVHSVSMARVTIILRVDCTYHSPKCHCQVLQDLFNKYFLGRVSPPLSLVSPSGPFFVVVVDRGRSSRARALFRLPDVGQCTCVLLFICVCFALPASQPASIIHHYFVLWISSFRVGRLYIV